MTDTDGVLVQKRWAEKVNNAIKPEPAEPKQRESLFYQIRPVTVSTAWTYSGGVWTSTGTFDDGQAVTVYRLEDSDASLSTGRFYVVWRGRWEVIGGDSSISITGGRCITVTETSAGYSVAFSPVIGTGLSLSQSGTVYTLSNSGVLSIGISGTSTAITGAVTFSSTYFTLSGSQVGLVNPTLVARVHSSEVDAIELTLEW